jgi:hypothetical protein
MDRRSAALPPTQLDRYLMITADDQIIQYAPPQIADPNHNLIMFHCLISDIQIILFSTESMH